MNSGSEKDGFESIWVDKDLAHAFGNLSSLMLVAANICPFPTESI